jgi:hypothetical protein
MIFFNSWKSTTIYPQHRNNVEKPSDDLKNYVFDNGKWKKAKGTKKFSTVPILCFVLEWDNFAFDFVNFRPNNVNIFGLADY